MLRLPKPRTLIIAAAIAASFLSFAGTIIFVANASLITVEMAALMLIALLGLYLGFGFLIVVYRLTGKLQ